MKTKIQYAYEPFVENPGELSNSQIRGLEKVADLSPGYWFEIHPCEGGPSSKGTRVAVWRDGYDRNYVGWVGPDGFTVSEKLQETYNVCMRVAHRVYRISPHPSK